MRRSVFLKVLALAGAAGLAVPAGAQVANVDPSGPPPPAAASAPQRQAAPDARPVPEWQSAATPGPADRDGPPAPPADPAAPPAEQGREVAFQRAHADVTNESTPNRDVLSAA